MQKLLAGAIALVLLVPSLARAQEPDHPCYMRTSSGRLINLDGVCGNTVNPPVTVPTSRGTAAAPASTKPSFRFNPAAYPADRYISAGEKDGIRYFGDKNSVRLNSKGFSGEVIGVGSGGTAKFPFSVDCVTRRFTVDKAELYNPQGQLVASQSTQWLLNTPGSEADQRMTAMCQGLPR